MNKPQKPFDDLFFSKYVGEKLNAIRNDKKITLLELATTINKTQPHLGNILHGRVVGNIELFRSIATEGLGLSSKWFDGLVVEAKEMEFMHSTGKEKVKQIISDSGIPDLQAVLRYKGIMDPGAVEDVEKFIELIKIRESQK